MNKMSLAILYELCIQKINQLQAADKQGPSFEQHLLEPMKNAIYEVVGDGALISFWGDANLCRYLKATVFKIQDELDKQEPSLDVIREYIQNVTPFLDKIGAKKEKYLWENQSIRNELGLLLSDVAELADVMPVIISNKDLAKHMKDMNLDDLPEEIKKQLDKMPKDASDEIKEHLKNLKKKYEEMKK